MKKLITIILFLSVCNSYAQDKKFSINTNLANLAAKGPSLSLEYQLSNKWSIQGYISKGEINILNNYNYRTAIIDFKRNLDGRLYTSTYMRYIEKEIYRPSIGNNVLIFDPGRDFKGNGVSAGQMLGYKYFPNKVYNIDVFAGIGYGGFIEQSGERNKSGFLDLRIGILTGFNF